MSLNAFVCLVDETGTPVAQPDAATSGGVDDAAYTDSTGAADGSVISLLKGIYMQLAVIAENTTPAG